MIAAALLVSNYCEPFAQRLSQVGQTTFHLVQMLFLELMASLSQQLALRFEPIGLHVTRQSKSTAAFGDEICPQANGVL